MEERAVVVAGWLTVDPDRRDEVVASHGDLLERARRAPGCLDLAISADPLEPGRINMFELWRSRADLDSWRAVANPPQEITPILDSHVQKHEVLGSGLPF